MATDVVPTTTPQPVAGSLQRDAAAATELARFVKEQNLSQTIQGREYMTSEAWSAAGRLLGLRVVCEDPVPFTGLENARGYSCRARLLDANGTQIAEASSICLRGEKRWNSAEEFAIYSMAQTRAVGKVHRVALSALAKLAGFEAAPAEEMPGETAQADVGPMTSDQQMPPIIVTREERQAIDAARKAAGLTVAEVKKVLEQVAGVTNSQQVRSDQLAGVLEAIEAAGIDDIDAVSEPDEPPEDVTNEGTLL